MINKNKIKKSREALSSSRLNQFNDYKFISYSLLNQQLIFCSVYSIR
jgi:hypothetical protein